MWLKNKGTARETRSGSRFRMAEKHFTKDILLKCGSEVSHFRIKIMHWFFTHGCFFVTTDERKPKRVLLKT